MNSLFANNLKRASVYPAVSVRYVEPVIADSAPLALILQSMYFSMLSAKVVAALAAAAGPAVLPYFVLMCYHLLRLLCSTQSAPKGVAALLLFALQLVADE